MTYQELEQRLAAARREPRRSYALAVPVVGEGDDLSLLFEVRSARLHTQPGEVCFPGGSIEAGETADQAALRELKEELGLTAQLGAALEPAGHQAGFSAQPFLVRPESDWQRQLRRNPDEVQETFTVPLAWFRANAPELYACRTVTHPPADFPFARLGFPDGYPWREGGFEVPVWFYGSRPIWGLTARVVRSLVKAL